MQFHLGIRKRCKFLRKNFPESVNVNNKNNTFETHQKRIHEDEYLYSLQTEMLFFVNIFFNVFTSLLKLIYHLRIVITLVQRGITIIVKCVKYEFNKNYYLRTMSCSSVLNLTTKCVTSTGSRGGQSSNRRRAKIHQLQFQCKRAN